MHTLDWEKALVPMEDATAILAALPEEGDQDELRRILGRTVWKLTFARTLREALSILNRAEVAAVICEATFPDGDRWRDLLDQIGKAQNPPLLIVTDRLADVGLWAEVLNIGAYDLLKKPFDAREVLHVLDSVRRSHNRTRAA